MQNYFEIKSAGTFFGANIEGMPKSEISIEFP